MLQYNNQYCCYYQLLKINVNNNSLCKTYVLLLIASRKFISNLLDPPFQSERDPFQLQLINLLWILKKDENLNEQKSILRFFLKSFFVSY